GVIISFLPALLLPVLGSLGFQGTTFGDSDFGVVGLLLGGLIELLSSNVLFLIIVAALLISVFVGATLIKRSLAKNNLEEKHDAI
ncbi:hypothetical protein R0J91_14190, partial [Micrococcus sp. SIMBA_131]